MLGFPAFEEGYHQYLHSQERFTQQKPKWDKEMGSLLKHG